MPGNTSRQNGNSNIVYAGMLMASLATAQAQTPPQAAALDRVVISGSRTETPISELPLTVDVVGADDMDARQLLDIRDLAKELPNVSVKRAPARFSVTGKGNPVGADSNAGFSIRGQGGNRVLMLIDGMRLPRSYINGSNAFGRDTIALELTKRIEIVHGPASVLYGTDAMAGLVNFITPEPLDFLKRSDSPPVNQAGKVWAAYSGDDHGAGAGAVLAARLSDTAEWSITGTTNRSGPMANMGISDVGNSDRTTPNPQSSVGRAFLGKLVIHPSAGFKHVLTVEQVMKASDVDLLSSRAKLPFSGTALQIAAMVADEKSSKNMERSRLTWDARYPVNLRYADTVQTALSWQKTAANDNGTTLRNDAGLRIRTTSYNERTVQANIQAQKTLLISDEWSQKTTYGFDFVTTDVNSDAGGSDPVPLPTFLARKYFPDTRDSSSAVFAQTSLSSSSWSITPGIRLDQYAIDVLSQQGYFPGIAASPGKALSGNAISPKVGVLFHAAPHTTVFGSLGSGFRAPEGALVNSALEVSTARLLPNPELKPEESRHVELGARLQFQSLTFNVSVFSNRYNNLIVEKKNLGTANGQTATVANPTLFQSVNIDKATISGFELRGNMDWGRFAEGRLSSPFSYGHTTGTNDNDGTPLSTIDPAKLTAGLKYETPDWEIRFDALGFASKDARQLDSAFIPKSTTLYQFTSPAGATFDLRGTWRARKGLRLNLAIINLADRKYWNWSDVQGLAANSTPLLIDAYTQPGRHANFSLALDF